MDIILAAGCKQHTSGQKYVSEIEGVSYTYEPEANHLAIPVISGCRYICRSCKGAFAQVLCTA